MALNKAYKGLKLILRLSKKPSRKEVWLTIRICLLGMVAMGLIAFVIKLIFTLVVGFVPPTSS